MPLPKPKPKSDEEAYSDDIASGRRDELPISNDCRMTLQYLPDYDNIAFSFYTKDLPGFTICISTADWSIVQEFIRNFNWRGRRQ